MAEVTGILVVQLQPVPGLVIDIVIFTEPRDVLGSGIYDARHRPFLPFTGQIKTAALILSPIGERLIHKQTRSQTKHVSFHHFIKRDLRGESGGSRLESEPILGRDRVPRFVPGAVEVVPVLRDTTEVFHISRRI